MEPIKKGVRIMTAFILSIKKSFLNASAPFSIYPTTNYRQHIPESAEQLMRDNWNKTGNSLRRAMKKVGEEIERQK